MRSSDWGADVCSSDRLAVIGVVHLGAVERDGRDATRIDVGQDYRLGHFEELLLLLLPVWFTFLEEGGGTLPALPARADIGDAASGIAPQIGRDVAGHPAHQRLAGLERIGAVQQDGIHDPFRSEEHTSELQSIMRISYAV